MKITVILAQAYSYHPGEARHHRRGKDGNRYDCHPTLCRFLRFRRIISVCAEKDNTSTLLQAYTLSLHDTLPILHAMVNCYAPTSRLMAHPSQIYAYQSDSVEAALTATNFVSEWENVHNYSGSESPKTSVSEKISDDSETSAAQYTVYFKSDGEIIDETKVKSGDTTEQPDSPTKSQR